MRIFRICPGFLIPSVCLNFIYQTRIRLVSACEDVTLFTARRPRLLARQTGKEHNMKDIKWTIQYDRPPAPLRHCKKCNIRQEFVSSGQFRVNAQGKYLDIWLIYKCSCCSSTWNAAIYSRVNPGNLPPVCSPAFTQMTLPGYAVRHGHRVPPPKWRPGTAALLPRGRPGFPAG